MNITKNLIAGLGGAIALNILHETLKHKKGMPRIDLLGEEAVQKSAEYFGGEIEDDNSLYLVTLAGDIISNGLYYSAIGVGSSKNLWERAASVGITAGMGAIALPEKIGLDPDPVADTAAKKALTVGYYLFGALVTAALLEVMKEK